MLRNNFQWLLVLFLIIPIWYFDYFPTIDGASHVATAANMLRLFSEQCPLVSRFYEFTKAPVPNFAGHFFMAVSDTFLDSRFGEKILLSIILLSFSLAIYVNMRRDGTNRNIFILPALLFVSSCAFIGTYNFLISYSLALFFLRWWRDNYTVLSPVNFFKLFFIYTALYFSHLFGYACFIICIGTSLFFDAWLQRHNFSFKKFAIICLFNLVAGVHTVILALWYLSLPKQPIEGITALTEKFAYVFFPVALYNFGETEKLLVMTVCCLVWMIIGLTLYSRFATKTALRRADYYFLIAIIFSILILSTPSTFAGGWMIESRLEQFMWLFLIIWLSSNNYSRVAKSVIAIAFIILLGGSLAINMEFVTKYNRILSRFAAAKDHIPENSIIFAQDISPFVIDYSTNEKSIHIPIPNITGYITASKCIVEISNFHAAEKNTFPIKYKDTLNPNIALGQFRSIYSMPIIPPIVDFKHYEKATGVRIDYVILRGNENYIYDYANDPNINPKKLYSGFMTQVNSTFTLDWQSTDGLVRIYKHKN